MTDRRTAASPWEVEAERRREVVASEVAAAREGERTDAGDEALGLARGWRLLRSLTPGSPDDRTRQAGRLNQKRV
jgi:hypothetical protein